MLPLEIGTSAHVKTRVTAVDGPKDLAGRCRNLVDGMTVSRRYEVIAFKIFFNRVDVLIIK